MERLFAPFKDVKEALHTLLDGAKMVEDEAVRSYLIISLGRLESTIIEEKEKEEE